MKKILLSIFLFLSSSMLIQAQEQNSLKFVTWNVEHLADSNDEGCIGRTEEQYAELREFAATMDADVVALQEVESAVAVARVFPEDEWDIVMSDRPDSRTYECWGSGNTSTQQKVGFAVRKGIPFETLESYDELAIGRGGLRYGVVIRLTGTPEPIDVMSIHMKSGCFVDDYSTSDRDDCEVFEQQVPLLDGWIESKIEENVGFVLMGDFNHRIANEENRLWNDLTEMDGESVSITNSMANLRGCHPRYPAPIDHVLVGSGASQFYAAGTEEVFYFGMDPDTMTEDDMLSDHCPVGVTLNFDQTFPPSTAVRWTQNSAEYKLITSSLYQQATANVEDFKDESNPWVVYMDVDETLLDNSEYNRRRDVLGLGFTPATWDEWVAEEAAGEVPGAKTFVETVLEQGGQIAMITNRDRSRDENTWRNLEALGFPITRENSCILGRNQADRDAVGLPGMINDKDLRRQQVSSGEATDCWDDYPEAEANWNRELKVVFHVGDNIKDFPGTTKENVDLEAFLTKQGTEILVLPNAIYGSWD